MTVAEKEVTAEKCSGKFRSGNRTVSLDFSTKDLKNRTARIPIARSIGRKETNSIR
jgi:enolase